MDKLQNGTLANRRILIVDDNASIHEDFKKVLTCGKKEDEAVLDALEAHLFETPAAEPAGSKIKYEIDSAFQGNAAIEMIKKAVQSDRSYALVFLDVRMPPGMDGIQTAKEIWQIAPTTQIVLCSAFMDYSHDDLLHNLGMTDNLIFMRKPFDAVAVNQVAISLTTKWNLHHQVQMHIEDLEKLVKQKSMMLVESNKMAALGHMAGGIAHEINNPLAIILLKTLTLAGKAKAGPVEQEELVKQLGTIAGMTERISKIVDSLRTISRDGNEDSLVIAPLKTIIEEALALHQERFAHSNIRIDLTQVADDIRIKCRRTQIAQLFTNLLCNSYDAIKELPEKWIKIQSLPESGNVTVLFSDSGNGIPENVRLNIFDPFFTTKEIGQGVGLGLSVARGIIESQGGTIALDESKPNTCFKIQLPKAS